MIRRLAFLIGLLLGLASIIQAGTAILTYFLTGKLTAIETKETPQGRRPVFKLISTDQALDMIKEQAAKGRIQFKHGQTPPQEKQEASDAA
jgi:hypothetical protein